jgi:hypothetical protein
MNAAARRQAVSEVTVITDPVQDDESRRVVQALGCRRIEGSPLRDGSPRGSRSVFVLTDAELDDGELDARLDVLAAYGIAVHRVVGEHPAVSVANRRLGYL